MTRRSYEYLVGGSFASIVIALYWVPRLIPAINGDIVSAAAEMGFNTAAAFWTAIIWAALSLLAFTLVARHSDYPMEKQREWTGGSIVWGEVLCTFAVFALAYFPVFLARHGPFMEDQYFLTALQRMNCAQLPYADFEFLYGPLMLYPLWGWSQVFGTGMTSYFGFLAILEGLQFAILIGVLQYLVPDRARRWLIFVLLLPFLFNTLLGLNYNGLRRLIPFLALILIVHRPYHWKPVISGGALLGVHLAYSHEYAIAALTAVLGLYGIQFLRGHHLDAVKFGGLTLGVALLVGASTMFLLLGSTLPAYFDSVSGVVKMMSRGHAGFEFYWTVNSLALFGLLSIAIAVTGISVARRDSKSLLFGDRMIIAAAIYAIVMLKSGLTRSDLWHLNAGFLILFAAFLLPIPSILDSMSRAWRTTATTLVAVAAATYLIGIAPTGSLYASSYVKGLADTVLGRENALPFASRGRSIESERTSPRAHILALSEFLAMPENNQRPVLFYGRAWVAAPLVGVCSRDYKLDDLMYSAFRKPEAEFLNENPGALVVLHERDYRNLFVNADMVPSRHHREMTVAKRVARWASTVHYDAASTESFLQDSTRIRLTGARMTATHVYAERFGEYFVLSPMEDR